MTKVSRFAGTQLAKGFKTDKVAEEQGVWRVHPDFGIHVKVRRATLPEHRRALRRFYKPFMHLTAVDPAQDLLVKQKAAAEVLVADWGQSQLDQDGNVVKGGDDQPIRVPMVDADGVEIRPTMENVLEAFIEMADFYAWVAGESDTFENYRAAVVEQTAGNSYDTSHGSTNGEAPAPSLSLSAVQPGANVLPPLSPVPS